jgi:hypothetical protein
VMAPPLPTRQWMPRSASLNFCVPLALPVRRTRWMDQPSFANSVRPRRQKNSTLTMPLNLL